MIKDSGNRTLFESGAVRDIQCGKGRCDLMPLDVIGTIYATTEFPDGCDEHIPMLFWQMQEFIRTGDPANLQRALCSFMDMEETFHTWSDMYLEVSIHFEEGANKYGERNWEKGIPVQRYVDSALRHFLKWLCGDTDERHDRAFCWNILCAMWTCDHHPELNEYGKGGAE